MARSYTLRIADEKGRALYMVKCEAYRMDTAALVETQHTNSSGVASFTALTDAPTRIDIKCIWAEKVRWFRDVFADARAVEDYGLSFYAKVTTYTDTTHFKTTNLVGKGNDFFNAYYVYVVRDAGGAGAAPQGELQAISDYASSDGTCTHSAFTTPLAVDDELLVVHPFIGYLLELKSTNIPADIADLITRTKGLDDIHDDVAALTTVPAGTFYDDVSYASIAPASSATANTYGTWKQISADIGASKRLYYLVVGMYETEATVERIQVEVSEGAASSEVAVARAILPLYQWPISGGPATPIIVPIMVDLTDNARIAVRAKDNVAEAITYRITVLVGAQ